MRLKNSLFVVLAAVLVFGCSKKESDTSDKSSAEKKSKGDDDDDKGDKKKKKKADDDDDDDKKKADKGGALDLSSVNGWSGYTIKAPKGAKASEDDDNVVIAGKTCDGCAYFEVVLSQKKPDLAATKKIQTDDAAAAKDKITFTAETATELEWLREGSTKSRNFVHVIKVGDDEIGCWPNSSVIAEADFKAMKEACDSVAKK